MPDIHLSMLALQVPNLLPRSIPWIDIARGKGIYINSHSEWPRAAGRLILSTLFFAIGIVIAYIWTRKPKPAEAATWAQTILGAMAVWAMMALGYGTIPHEWATFGTSYLDFSTANYLMHKNSVLPFDITRSVVVDIGVTVIYGVVLVLQVWLFVRWQKRPAFDAEAAASVESGEQESGGPLSRLRRRREKRVSAYGRPVTTAGE